MIVGFRPAAGSGSQKAAPHEALSQGIFRNKVIGNMFPQCQSIRIVGQDTRIEKEVSASASTDGDDGKRIPPVLLLFDADDRLKLVQLPCKRGNQIDDGQAFALIIKLRITGKEQRPACLRKPRENGQLLIPLADTDFA